MTKTIAEKILEKREAWFSQKNLTDKQLELLSKKWHKLMNRYNQMVMRSYIEN